METKITEDFKTKIDEDFETELKVSGWRDNNFKLKKSPRNVDRSFQSVYVWIQEI